jgi:leucyl/phenylalanyl-tRNA--protein transferase
MAPTLRLPDARALARGPEVLALTDDSALTVPNLLHAYRAGVFPWPGDPKELIPWCCPFERGVLPFDRMTPGRTLQKAARKPGWSYSIDRAFPEVIAACASAPRSKDNRNWISPAVEAAYTALHHAGAAHSVEVWYDGELAGGLYGVDAGGFFSGESMFHRRDNASKLAILFLRDFLLARGQGWLDIQQLTPHMERLGATEISRASFLTQLQQELASGRKLFG